MNFLITLVALGVSIYFIISYWSVGIIFYISLSLLVNFIIPNFALLIFYKGNVSYENVGIFSLIFIVFYIGLELVGMDILGEGTWMMAISSVATVEIFSKSCGYSIKLSIRTVVFLISQAVSLYLIYKYGNELFNYATFEIFFIDSYLIMYCLENNLNKWVFMVCVFLLLIYSAYILVTN